jgi:serine/threonine protein kinase
MGELHRARDAKLGREAALKNLSAHLSASPDLRRRLEREGKTVSSSNHPRICTRLEELRGRQEGSGQGMIRSHRATKAS